MERIFLPGFAAAEDEPSVDEDGDDENPIKAEEQQDEQEVEA